jgi:hypothetical protein
MERKSMSTRKRVSHRGKTLKPTQELAPSGIALAPHPKFPGRNVRGCWTADNTDSMTTHRAYSRRRREELTPMRQEMRTAILADRGFTESDVPRVLSTIVDQFCEARLIAFTYFQFLANSGGPITAKGRQRRAVDGYLKASDRVAKLAGMVGLDRRQKETTLADWFAEGGDDDPSTVEGNGNRHTENDNTEEHHVDEEGGSDHDHGHDRSTDTDEPGD